MVFCVHLWLIIKTELLFMKIKPFKLALVQMLVKGGEKTWNINHALNLIGQAADNGADIILLPECMDLGWTHPSSLKEADALPEGEPCKMLAEAAVKNDVYICAGLTEKSGNNVFNSAVIIDRKGELKCAHRKINELDIGREFYSLGDRRNIVQTDFCTFGLMICADGLAKDHLLSRTLCYMGAQVILSPCSWAVPAKHNNIKEPYGNEWRNAYKPVAKEFSVWIAGVSNVGEIDAGPWAGRKCIGCSLVIGPNGEEILQGPYGVAEETILYIDIDGEDLS